MHRADTHMARGFESKDVEYQQAEAQRPAQVRAVPSPEARADANRRAALELALRRTRSQLDAATRPAHRQMLERAISDLEAQLTPSA